MIFKRRYSKEEGFALIELLTTIGIIAAGLTLIVITVNPFEVRKQWRDRKRIAEINTFREAINLYRENVADVTLGASSTVYVSVPDPAIAAGTSTCPGMGLPGLPDGWTYYCSNPNDFRNVDGTGWLPLNFQSLAIGSLFTSLPIDSVNTTSSGLYYTYVPGGSFILATTTTFVTDDHFVVTNGIESRKFREEVAIKDGGSDPFRLEKGDVLRLWADASGLLAYWSFNEKSGTVAPDASHNNHDGSLIGFNFSGASNWTTDAKIGGALEFDGVDDYVDIGDERELKGMAKLSVELWVNAQNLTTTQAPLEKGAAYEFRKIYSSGVARMRFAITTTGGSCPTIDSPPVTVPGWHHYVLTYNGAQYKAYFNGQQALPTRTCSGTIANFTLPLWIGRRAGTSVYFDGIIDEVRIYNRALTPEEILLHYNLAK